MLFKLIETDNSSFLDENLSIDIKRTIQYCEENNIHIIKVKSLIYNDERVSIYVDLSKLEDLVGLGRYLKQSLILLSWNSVDEKEDLEIEIYNNWRE